MNTSTYYLGILDAAIVAMTNIEPLVFRQRREIKTTDYIDSHSTFVLSLSAQMIMSIGFGLSNGILVNGEQYSTPITNTLMKAVDNDQIV